MTLRERLSQSQSQTHASGRRQAELSTSPVGTRLGGFQAGTKPIYAVVACTVPGMNSAAATALGLQQGEAVFINVAGGGNPHHIGELERSLLAAILLLGAQEIIIFGHQACEMGQVEMNSIIDGFRKRGVTRQAFGDVDLRRWFGVFPSAAKNVQELVEKLNKSAVIPSSVSIHGLLLDDPSGKVEMLVEGKPRVGPEATLGSPKLPPSRLAAGPSRETRSDQPTSPVGDSSADAVALKNLRPEAKGLRANEEILTGQSQFEGFSVSKQRPATGTLRQASELPRGSASRDSSLDLRPQPVTDFNSAFLYLRQFLAQVRSDDNLKGRVADLKYRLTRERDPAKFLQTLETFAGQFEEEREKLLQAVRVIRSTVGDNLSSHELKLLVKNLFP
jgi:carbonic anhydrase